MTTLSSDETNQGILDAFRRLTNKTQIYDDEPFRDDFEDDDGDGEAVSYNSLEEEQGSLCQKLLRRLQSRGAEVTAAGLRARSGSSVTATNDSSGSLRSLFPDCRVADLLPILVSLLQDRVDAHDLMPATQDVEANEEILNNPSQSALSLTLPAMQAAHLYAHLLCRPGALGSGLVDLEALTALTALIRRWTTESIGREWDAAPGGARSGARQSRSNNNKITSPTKSPPKKRSRRNQKGLGATNNHDGGNEDSLWGTDHAQSEPCSQSTLALGCNVAMEVCMIPQQPEFASWSSEAREGLLEGVLDAMGTAAALFGGRDVTSVATTATLSVHSCDGGADSDRNDNCNIGDLILQQGQRALEACICNTEKDHNHDTALVILRGILHLLQLKVALPNGERGKMEAHNEARQVLASLMEKNLDLAKGPSYEGDASSHLQTPSRDRSSRRSSLGASIRHARKNRRISLDGGQTPMTSPALKKKSRGSLVPTATSEPVLASISNKERRRGLSAMFLGLLQKLASGRAGLEKATLRRSTVQTLSSCMKWMSHLERTHFLRYLLKLCHSKVSVHRLVACDVMGSVLSQVWLSDHRNDIVLAQKCVDDDDDDDDDDSDCPDDGIQSHPTPSSADGGGSLARRKSSASKVKLPSAILKALQGRLVDRAAAVRASALASLQGALAVAAVATHSDIGNTIRTTVGFVDLEGDEADDTIEDLLLALRRRAMKDEAATVRKTAIQTLTKLLVVRRDLISEFYVSPICEQCQDPSLLVRKSAAESLTMLLIESIERPHDGMGNGHFDGVDSGLLIVAWSSCVLPMVLDDETSSKAVDCFYSVVVSPLVEDPDRALEKQHVAWHILAQVGCFNGKHGASKGAIHALRKAVSSLSRDNHDLVYVELLDRAVNVASESLKEESNPSEAMMVGSWCLLEALLFCGGDASAMIGNILESNQGLDFCLTAWQRVLQKRIAEPKRPAWLTSTLKSCLVVLSKVCSGLTSSQSDICFSKLKGDLAEFRIPPDAVSAAVGALVELTLSKDSQNSCENCTIWIETLARRCENEIAGFLQEAGKLSSESVESSGYVRENLPRLVRALFTAGELTMIGFRLDDDEKTSQDRDMSEDPLHGLHVHPSKRMQELIQITVSDCLPGSSNVKTPLPVRAHGFTVLGKFCLRDEKLARASLNLLARELHPGVSNANPTVQNNALLVMGDLCVRYTNMTDRYLPIMAACLQSGTTDLNNSILNSQSASFAMVRKHAVLLLSSLLLQDYIKWRGLLFHRFLVACSDDDQDVATLAESVLSGPLWSRNPKLFLNHFVESIFVLNNCTAHPIYISASRQGDGGSGIAVGFEGVVLDGEMGQARRRRIYDFLLSKLSDEEKIGVTARLAKDVFGAAIEDDGNLSLVCQGPPPHKNLESSKHLSSAWNVLTDTFYVLTSKAIKVGNKSQEESMDTSIEDPNIPNPSRQVTVAKSRLLSKISRKHLIEIVLPILCDLKAKLQASCSPLLKDLMAYLLDIFGNYKVEVKEFLANDRGLLQEIEFDARQNAI